MQLTTVISLPPLTCNCTADHCFTAAAVVQSVLNGLQLLLLSKVRQRLWLPCGLHQRGFKY